MDATITGSSVAKSLASCNKSTRERALRLLKGWLSSHSSSSSSTVSDDDLLKIWKGLFYCVWHADKLPVQLDLINRLSSLLVSLDLSLSIRYFEAFIATIRREWSGIDHLRLDKFYLLIRKFLHQFFLLLSNNSWDLDLSVRMIELLSEKSLLVVDKFLAQGVNYHISEIFLDEIRDFLPVTPATVDALLKPFFTVLERSSDKVLVKKIKSKVFDRLLENGVRYLESARGGDDVDLGDEVEKFGKITLALGLSKKFFDSASSPDTVQGNRKVLFSLHEEFQKLEKDLEKSGVHISFPQENGNSVKATEPVILESTEQVDVDMENGDEDLSEKPSKKRKKSKKTLSGRGKKSRTRKNDLSDSDADIITSTATSENGNPSNGENLNGDITENRTKKISAAGGKKSRTKKNDSSASVSENITFIPTNDNDNFSNGENPSGDIMENGDLISFDETLVSNLQKQFEKVAAEAGMAINSAQSGETPVTSTAPKKRKRVKSTEKKVSTSPRSAVAGSTTGKSGEKSAKKVRFSMKNNLVWKPHSPLPPQSLRLPPSATPRGSALKKGLPPGPIRETPSTTKKKKVKANSVKKSRKASKSVSPAVKRLRMLQSLSV